MSPRASSWLAWSLAGLSFALLIASLTLYVLIFSVRVPSSLGASRTLPDMLVSVPFLSYSVVGALIVSRRPHHPIGWICIAEGLLWALLNLFDLYSVYGLVSPGSVPFPLAIAGLSQWLWVPTVGLLAIFLPLLFPDGRLPSRTWRPLAWLSVAVIVLLAVSQGLVPGPISDLGGERNPFGIEGQPWLTEATNIILVPFLMCILASALSLVLRYRRSGGEERQQIKWIAFAASFAGLGFASVMGSGLIVLVLAPETYGDIQTTSPLWFELWFYVVLVSFGGISIAVGIAVLRYRLYDIDVVINRTLVYGALTVTLVLVYFGSVVVLQRTFVFLTGEVSQLTIVASTLAIASLFSPLRRRIQAFVDRRFYRRKYDARRTLDEFGAMLREETDLDGLSTQLLAVTRETMQPEHASLWLWPTSRSGPWSDRRR